MESKLTWDYDTRYLAEHVRCWKGPSRVNVSDTEFLPWFVITSS